VDPAHAAGEDLRQVRAPPGQGEEHLPVDVRWEVALQRDRDRLDVGHGAGETLRQFLANLDQDPERRPSSRGVPRRIATAIVCSSRLAHRSPHALLRGPVDARHEVTMEAEPRLAFVNVDDVP